MRAMMYQNIDKIIQSHPTHRWVFLTLTVKTLMFLILPNFERDECRLANEWFNPSVLRVLLMDLLEQQRSQDLKKSERMNVHPHFHAMLLVKSTYFKPRLYKSSGMDGYVD